MTVAAIVNPRFTAWDTDGSVLSSGKLYTYEAGSTTDEKTTYSDPDLTTANANPVILDSKGQADVYYEGTARLRLFTSDDTLVWDRDKIATVGDTNVEWVSSVTPTFASSTTFTLSGDQTDTYHPGRRIRCTDSSTLYGYIQASSYSDPNTTVTVSLDSGSLSSSLSAVAVGLMVATENFSAPPIPALQNTHDADYTLVRSDIGKILVHSASANANHTYTIPLNSAVDIPAGVGFWVLNLDSGTVTVTADSTATLRAVNGESLSDGDVTVQEGQLKYFYKDGTDTWLCSGVGQQGSLSLDATGFSGGDLSVSFSYSKIGKFVTMSTGSTTGTSNATTMTAGTIPSNLRPTSSRRVLGYGVVDNGSAQYCSVTVGAAGTLSFFLLDTSGATLTTTGFTASGSKGFGGLTFSYMI